MMIMTLSSSTSTTENAGWALFCLETTHHELINFWIALQSCINLADNYTSPGLGNFVPSSGSKCFPVSVSQFAHHCLLPSTTPPNLQSTCRWPTQPKRVDHSLSDLCLAISVLCLAIWCCHGA